MALLITDEKCLVLCNENFSFQVRNAASYRLGLVAPSSTCSASFSRCLFRRNFSLPPLLPFSLENDYKAIFGITDSAAFSNSARPALARSASARPASASARLSPARNSPPRFSRDRDRSRMKRIDKFLLQKLVSKPSLDGRWSGRDNQGYKPISLKFTQIGIS